MVLGLLGIIIYLYAKPAVAPVAYAPSRQINSVDARHTNWTDTFSHLQQGDILCAAGTVSNRLLTDHNEMIEVGPDGIDVKEIDGFTQRYPQFPMLAFLGRVNGDDHSIFAIHKDCAAVPFAGQDFQIIVNVPYKDEHGFMATGMASNKDLGNFTFLKKP